MKDNFIVYITSISISNVKKIEIEEQVKNSNDSFKTARKENQLLLHSFYKNAQVPKK